MKRTLIRYKTRPDRIEENAQLVAQVFRELHEKKPEDVRYMTLRLHDGTFIHIVENESDVSPIPQLTAFRAFQSGMSERCLEQPQSSEVVVVGQYRMMDA